MKAAHTLLVYLSVGGVVDVGWGVGVGGWGSVKGEDNSG